MKPETILDKVRGCVRVGQTGTTPWALVRFKDMWDAGLDKARGDKLEAALEQVLAGHGIRLRIDPATDEKGYVTFVSAQGLTIYVGNTEITDWIDIGKAFDDLKEVIEEN